MACYRPHILDGGLKCAPVTVKRCPDGLQCDPASNTCRTSVADSAPIDQVPDPADARDLPVDPTVDRSEAMCLAPRPDCVAQTPAAVCDPYCRSGCGCSNRCSVTAAGLLTCNAPGSAALAVGQTCSILSSGMPVQTDDCAPGLVCLPGCGMRCFQFCRTDADCPQSSCTRAPVPTMNLVGVKVCEVPFVACDPLNALAGGCSTPGQTCYLSPVVPDKSFCDCPAGDTREGESCASPQDCIPGLTCVDAGNGAGLRCRPACNRTVPASCGVGTTCRAINGSKTYGFCS